MRRKRGQTLSWYELSCLYSTDLKGALSQVWGGLYGLCSKKFPALLYIPYILHKDCNFKCKHE